MTDPWIPRLAEVLVAAQRRYRSQRGWGAIVTPVIPNGLIDEVAAGLAPVLRELMDESVAVRVSERIEEVVDARLTELGFDLDILEAS